jgi:hypothetical protein
MGIVSQTNPPLPKAQQGSLTRIFVYTGRQEMNRNCNLQSGQKLETDDQLSMQEKQNLQKEQNNTMT